MRSWIRPSEIVPGSAYMLVGPFVVHASRVHNVQPGRPHHNAQILEVLVVGPAT